MKDIFFFIVVFLATITLNAKNPIVSPTFDNLVKSIIGGEEYIFDDKNITMKVPNFADNPVQVPIFVDASKIKDAQRMILFADLNPIAEILDMPTTNLLPIFSSNIKVAQETPLRAMVKDSKGLWHIGSINIHSNGGGCDISSQASQNSEFAKFLGKTKGQIFDKGEITRIKASVFHPMETGLIFGNVKFFIDTILIKDGEKVIDEIKLTPAISENPRLIFETRSKFSNLNLLFKDNDANEFELKLP